MIQADERATLPRELSEFLIELSIGVHRYAMYPVGHPSLAPVMENLVGRLGDIFEHRRALRIGVAQPQLIVEGMATDQRNPVLADLARRLHGHQLGAVSITEGVTSSEISGLLQALARESERGGTPIGLLPRADVPAWAHARLHPVGYERLEMHGGVGSGTEDLERAAALWVELAQAALEGEAPPSEPPDGAELARAIEAHVREADYDGIVVGYLLQLAEELKGSRGGEVEKIRKRVSRLLMELDDDTLSSLVRFGGDAAQRRSFLLDANQTLTVDAVVKLLRAAAGNAGQDISNSMTRLLNKLATHAESGGGHVGMQADMALRENVEALIEGWELEDPNPQSYTAVLDQMSRAAPVLGVPEEEGESISGAERIVETALEVDAYGPIVAKAMSDLIREGSAGRLLEMVDEAPDENNVAERIRGYLTSPAEFREILGTGQVDEEAIRRLVRRMGSAAVDPLLDVLADSDSRSVRRRVFDVLGDMGPWVGQRTVERLSDGRWFVLRNMLALLQRLEPLPQGFDPRPFVEHPDPRVRREALPLALRSRDRRARTLAAALADEDERMVRMALIELREEVPEALLPTLVNRVVASEERGAEIRALGARTLRKTRSHLALNVLLEITSPGKGLFGKAKLAPGSPEVLAALETLAGVWPDEPRAASVLESAAHSKDPSIRRAVREGLPVSFGSVTGWGGMHERRPPLPDRPRTGAGHDDPVPGRAPRTRARHRPRLRRTRGPPGRRSHSGLHLPGR